MALIRNADWGDAKAKIEEIIGNYKKFPYFAKFTSLNAAADDVAAMAKIFDTN